MDGIIRRAQAGRAATARRQRSVARGPLARGGRAFAWAPAPGGWKLSLTRTRAEEGGRRGITARGATLPEAWEKIRPRLPARAACGSRRAPLAAPEGSRR